MEKYIGLWFSELRDDITSKVLNIDLERVLL
jgi:hypothetical protein